VSTVDLERLLAELPIPDSADGTSLRFAAATIGKSEHRLGRGSNGEPALLFAAATAGTTSKRPTRIELEHISVQHDVTCWITGPDGEQTSSAFTVVQFAGGDAQLRTYFLRIASALVVSLGASPTSHAVQDAVRRLVELFRSLAQPPAQVGSGALGRALCAGRIDES
jgi:hypothetical protein